MTQHERMKTACGRNSWVRQLSQARVLSSSFSIAASTNTSSQSKTCACKKQDRHHHDASTAQKETETSTNTTRRAKFSKPPQRRTPKGGKHCGIPRVCERKFHELRHPLAVLVAQWSSPQPISVPWNRVVDSEMTRPLIETPTMTGRCPTGTHNAKYCIKMADLPTRLPRSGSFLQLRREKDPEATDNVQANFPNLVTAKKTALT